MAVLPRQVDPTQIQIARHVLQEVDELETGADVVRPRRELLVAGAAENPQNEPPDRIRRQRAVRLQVGPGLVLGDALVLPVALDQPPEGLARKRAGPDRRLELAHHRPVRLAGVAEVELPLELVERGEPVALPVVPEQVDQPRETVDRPQMGPVLAREQE